VLGPADTSKLRLPANSDVGSGSVGTNAAPNAHGEDDDVAPISMCLPRAVAPEIVPVILAFLYTDRFIQQPDFGPDGYAEEYCDPGVAGNSSLSEATLTGGSWDGRKGKGITPSKVRTKWVRSYTA